jgi:capsular polysaccharide biosynthesis protein
MKLLRHQKRLGYDKESMNEVYAYLKMLKRGWWIVSITALSAFVIALAASWTTTPIYRTSSQYIVSPNNILIEDSDLFRSLDTLDRRSIITTYAEVFSSKRMFDAAAATALFAGTDLSGYRVTAVVLPETNILEVSIEGSNPEMIAALANAIGQHSVEYIRSLYQIYDISLLDVAEAPTRPISPTPLKDAGVAIVLGLFLGGVLAIGYAYISEGRWRLEFMGNSEAAESTAV